MDPLSVVASVSGLLDIVMSSYQVIAAIKDCRCLRGLLTERMRILDKATQDLQRSIKEDDLDRSNTASVQRKALYNYTDSRTPYAALSYSCGSGDRDLDLERVEWDIRARGFLVRVLDEMRQPGYVCRLWIDAICIDQREQLDLEYLRDSIRLQANMRGEGRRPWTVHDRALQLGEDCEAMVSASKASDEEAIWPLLYEAADKKRTQGYHTSALHTASRCGYDKVVDILLASGAAVEARDENGDVFWHPARTSQRFMASTAGKSGFSRCWKSRAGRHLDAARRLTRKTWLISLCPSCLHVMRDYAAYQSVLMEGKMPQRVAWHTDDVLLLPMDQESAHQKWRAEPLVFFAATMLWLTLERMYYSANQRDRYQMHATLLSIGAGLALGNALGLDFAAASLGIVPWSVYWGLILSDLGHTGVRVLSTGASQATPYSSEQHHPLVEKKSRLPMCQT